MAALAQATARLNTEREAVTVKLREYEAQLIALRCGMAVMLALGDGREIGWTQVSGRWMLAYTPLPLGLGTAPTPQPLLEASTDTCLLALERLPQLTDVLTKKVQEHLARVERAVNPLPPDPGVHHDHPDEPVSA